MRPLRLVLDGFGAYRHQAEADFSDVDFFALVGPTGSGKSTLIDGLCFALYGTVPRWGKENAIAFALAPSANACRVCLVFEAAGKRYAAVRALTRDRKGQVHTKEARLERLDPAIPPDAPLSELLQASVEPLAEGPDQVKAAVQELLGLSYEHFTQSVLLPQGRFAEFLHAKPGDRQDLLVQLLAFGVYEQIGQRARERARRADDAIKLATSARAELAGATEQAEAEAEARLNALTGLATEVNDGLAGLAGLTEQAAQAAAAGTAAREEAALLAAVRMPAEVPGLAERISRADALITERAAQQADAEQLESDAEHSRAQLPDQTLMERMAAAHAERRRLASQLAGQERAEAAAAAAEAASDAELQDAERKSERAADDLAGAQREHAAADLASGLHSGDDCPVCLRRITEVPHHATPADLGRAAAAADAAAKEVRRLKAAHSAADRAAAAARGTAEATRHQLAELTEVLAGCPPEDEVAATIKEMARADEELRTARKAAAAGRGAVADAQRARSSLDGAERQAWTALRDARDQVVRLGAPRADAGDLAKAWTELAGWAAASRSALAARQRDLDGAARDLQQRAASRAAALTGLLASHGITGLPDPAQAAVAISGHLARAEQSLNQLREDRKRAARLDRQIAAHREEQQVAGGLGTLLRATSFERWLCGEALDSLVEEASATLMELSGGQYQLDRDDRNDLVVIDYEDAGARRPVHTLSGGETFQAALALALALSRQVVGLSAGQRDLNSMFLDEGFGTLDADTLEAVAATLERLAADSDRMVGIVTHVAALAERVPVRFVVGRAGSSSTLTKERT
jgi:exonuclease SbcC